MIQFCGKRLFFFFTVFGLYASSDAQVDLTKYFEPNTIPLLNRNSPLKVNFKWDMKGREQVLLNDGLNNLDEGYLRVALGDFDTLINISYKSWVGHYYRGEVLMRLNRLKEAASEFTAVTKLNPNLPEGYIELGVIMELRHQGSDAEEQYQKAIEVDPKFAYAYYKKGNRALSTGFIEDAIIQYKKCNKIKPDFPDAYMAQGIISFLKDKKYENAISFCNSALKADSTFSAAYFWRGLSQLELGKKEKCLQDWDRYIRFNPRNPFVMTMRGFLKAELGNFDEAFTDFRKVFQTINLNEDKFQGAQTSLDKRLDLQFAANYLIKTGYGLRENVFDNLKAAFCLLLMDQEKKAYEYLRKAELMNSSSILFFLMAITFEHSGNHTQAFAYYNKALNFDNDIFDAHKKRSIYLSEMKREDAAYKEIDEMLRIQPGAPIAFKLKGRMEANQRKFQEAIADLTRFINFDSTDTEALKLRAMCLVKTQRPKEATPDLMRLFYLNPNDESLYENVINDHMAIGDTLNASIVLQDFCSKHPRLGPLIVLARILISQNKYAEASKQIVVAKEIVQEQQAAAVNGKIVLVFTDQSGQIRSELRSRPTDETSTVFYLEGLIAFHQSLYEETLKALKKSLAENSGNLEALYLKAKCHLKLNDTKKALADLKELKTKNYLDSGKLFDSLSSN